MNVLEKILEEIEHEAMTNKEIGRKQCEGMARAMNIIHSYMDKSLNNDKHTCNDHAFVVKNMTPEQFKETTKNQKGFKEMERFKRNKGCSVYEVDSNVMEDVKPVSREYLKECAETAQRYQRNTDHEGVENINVEKIKAINKEMEDYLFEKYCVEGFDEELDKIFKKYLDFITNINTDSENHSGESSEMVSKDTNIHNKQAQDLRDI